MISDSVTVITQFRQFFIALFLSFFNNSTMTRSAREKGKAKEDDAISKTETFSQLLMGGEEEFDEYLGENETLDDDDEEEPMSTMIPHEEDDDDDKDSFDAWLKDDEEQYIDDSEIT